MDPKAATAQVIRQARIARGWTQAHLADAAMLSERTVQRCESGHVASSETLMALAAVLDITLPTVQDAGHVPSLAPTVLAVTFCLPSAFFIAINIGYYELDFLSLSALQSWVDTGTILAWPIVVLGGPIIAIGVVLRQVLHIDACLRHRRLRISGISVALAAGPLAAAAFAALLVGILLAYELAETLGHIIARGP